MKRLKPLSSTIKEKNRYLVYKVISENEVDFSSVKNAIKEGVINFVGNLDLARLNLFILDNWKDQKGILKVEREHLDTIRACLIWIRKINKEPVILKVIGVSGTINKVKKKFFS